MESVSRREGLEQSAILAIVAGALMLAGGVAALSVMSMGTTQPGMTTMRGGPSGGGMGMMGGGIGGWVMMSGGFMWATVWTAVAISIGAGVVSVVGGYAIHKQPESSGIWGIAILISGIVGLVGLSGFFIGPILGIVGGILALVRK
jgi:hypothetical protein